MKNVVRATHVNTRSEASIQAEIIKYLNTRCYAVKVIVANRAGTPDLLLCYKGRFVALEVKRANGKMSKLQEIHAAQIRENQGFSFVVRSVEDVENALREVDNAEFGS